jgi:Xaa-Pro aminopeptidase
MAQANYDALVVPRADEYLGEYIPLHKERLRWISGFTGSAGAALILRERAAMFVDGRYTVQVRNEVPADLFAYHHLIEEPQAQWLATAPCREGARVACDPRLHSLHWYPRDGKHAGRSGCRTDRGHRQPHRPVLAGQARGGVQHRAAAG